MYIAIRKEPDGSLYMDKYFFNRYNDSDLGRYNYTKVKVPDVYYEQATTLDFDPNVLLFDESRYLSRIEEETKQKELPLKLARLEEITKDMAQVTAGFIVPDIEDKKAEFRQLLNEVRYIQGKNPREEIV